MYHIHDIFYFSYYFISMNKKLLLLALPAVLVVWGCFGSQDANQTTDDSVLSWTTAMNTTQPTLEQCQAAVTSYLESQKNITPDTSKKVQSGSAITVDYIGRLANGEVFDTSIESVAKECGLYNEARGYGSGLDFVAGSGQVVAGFDEGVMNMTLNETKTIEMTADKAYGGETIALPKEWFPTKSDGSAYVAGDTFQTMMGTIEIVAVGDKEITIKNPSPLAGKDLIFDVTVKAIQ